MQSATKTCFVLVLAGALAGLPLAAQAYAPEPPVEPVEVSAGSDAIETLLHSLALYILTADMMGFLADGNGQKLEEKYSDHPGWIPAMAHASYDEVHQALYVPVGVCLWSINVGKRGRLEFVLLQPRDGNLEDWEREALLGHLFGLVQEAELQNDYSKAFSLATLAGRMLSPEPVLVTEEEYQDPGLRHRKGIALDDNL